METILNVGIILSFFLGILLFTKKHKMLSDKILAFWLIVIGIHLLGYSIYYQGYWEQYPHLIGITIPFPFFYGPLLYLYVLYSLKTQKQLAKIDYLHFAPILLSYLFLIPFYFYSAEQKTKVVEGLVDDYDLFSKLLLVGFILSGFSYVFLAYRKLLQRKKIIDANFSNHENINLNWLRYAILSIGSVVLVLAILTILREVLEIQFSFNPDLIFYSIIVGYVVYVGFSGIKQQGVFSDNIKNEKELVPIKEENKYKKSGLKADLAKAKHNELLAIMTSEKPFLNPKLSLNELAQKLSISSNHLSQIINQYEQVNFHDFVNKYRVNEFIEKAKSNSMHSLLAIALDSGFNSKSSFNNVFKKIKKTTPSQYINNVNQGLKSCTELQ